MSHRAEMAVRARLGSNDQRSRQRRELDVVFDDARLTARGEFDGAPVARHPALLAGEVADDLELTAANSQPALLLIELDPVDVAGRQSCARVEQIAVQARERLVTLARELRALERGAILRIRDLLLELRERRKLVAP